MVKVLCLHGIGTNADILKAQTASIRTLLPNHYEWHFVDGEQECEPTPGADGIFPPPFLAFHLEPSYENICEALDLIDDVIESEGPFDAVMGFSQGGALAATTVMKHQILRPFEPPPFRVAIFLCANLPWSWSSEHGYDVTTLVMKGRSGSTDFEEWKSTATSATTKEATEEFLTDLPDSIQQLIRERANALGDGDIPHFKRFHAQACQERIAIPTVHLIGMKDKDRQQSLALIELCTEDMAQMIQHPGGHEMPRDRDINKSIGEAIQRAITRAELVI